MRIALDSTDKIRKRKPEKHAIYKKNNQSFSSYFKNLILYLSHFVKHRFAKLSSFSTLFHDYNAT